MSETNADRIREMNIDELAGIIMCPYDVEPEHCVGPGNCMGCCKKWLESEVAE